MATQVSVAQVFADIITFVQSDEALHDILKIILALVLSLASLSTLIERQPTKGVSNDASRWLASTDNPSKRACEMWFLGYGAFWISCFAVIIASQVYLQFQAEHYMLVCGGLAAPLLLQPLLLPSLTHDQNKSLLERHSFKANLWIFVFGFIGNYW